MMTYGQPSPRRVVLGQWKEDGTGYHQVAHDQGGTWYQSTQEVYPTVKAIVGDEAGAVLWQTNEAFLHQQLEARVPRFEFTGLDIKTALEKDAVDAAEAAAKGRQYRSPARVQEIRYLQQHGPTYGYRQDGNAFTRGP